jgi:hypothetical protein
VVRGCERVPARHGRARRHADGHGAGQTGSSLITQACLDELGTNRLKKGDVFTIGTGATGVFAVNPQNYRSTTQLQQFVVTADTAPRTVRARHDSDLSADRDLGRVSDRECFAGRRRRITIVGAASTVTPQGLGFHPSAFVMATADLPEPKQGKFKRVRMPGVGRRCATGRRATS